MVDEAVDQAVTVMAVLADRHRLGILAQLRGGEVGAGELQRRLGITQPLTSYHLRVLSEAGLVRSRHDPSDLGFFGVLRGRRGRLGCRG